MVLLRVVEGAVEEEEEEGEGVSAVRRCRVVFCR